MIPAALGQVQTAGSNVEFLHYSNRDKNQFTGQIIYLFLKFYGKKKKKAFYSIQDKSLNFTWNITKSKIQFLLLELKEKA